MSKTIVKVGLGILTFFIILIAIASILLLNTDPNQYKEDIQKAIYTATGAKLTLGDIQWQLWPHFTLQLTDLSLATDLNLATQTTNTISNTISEAASNNQLIAVNKASLEVALLPLLKSQIRVDHFTLHKPAIWFHQNESGQHNWQPLLNYINTQESKNIPESPTEQPIQQKMNLDLAINQMSISEGMLTITGAQTATINPLNINIRNIQLNKPIDISIDSVITQLDQHQKQHQKHSLDFKTIMTINDALNSISLEKLSIQVQAFQAQDDHAEPQATLEGRAHINLDTVATTATINIKPLNLDAWIATSTIQNNKGNNTNKDNGSNKKTQDNKTTSTEPTPLPKEALQNLQLNTHIILEEVILKGAPHTLAFHAKANNGILQLNKIALDAYNGSANGTIELNVTPTPAKLMVNLDINQMAMKPILSAWTGLSPLSGEINSKLAITTTGDTVEALIAGLQGETNIAMENTTLPPVHFHDLLWKNLQEKQSNLVTLLDSFPELKEELGTLKTPKILRNSTDIQNILASFTITPEIIQSQKITASFNNQPIEAHLLYGRKTQDITLNTHVQFPFNNKELKHIVWPLSCTGSLAHRFRCSLDSSALQPVLKQLAQQEAKNAIKEELAPIEEKAKNKVKEKLAPIEEKAKNKAKEELNRSLNTLFN